VKTVLVYLALRTQFFNDVTEGNSGLTIRLIGRRNYVQILKKIFVLFERQDYRYPLAISVGDVLNTS
jgi:hypothetical protein